MKLLGVIVAGLACVGIACAADPAMPTFGNERIGVPPLSLREAVGKQRAGKPFQFGAQMPSHASAQTPSLTSKFFARSESARPPETSNQRRFPAPRLAPTESHMPIVEPDPSVDYRIARKEPDPSVDFKMRIIAPALATHAPANSTK